MKGSYVRVHRYVPYGLERVRERVLKDAKVSLLRYSWGHTPGERRCNLHSLVLQVQ
jgi:hypothetical protein